MTLAQALRHIRQHPAGLPISHLPDKLTDELLERGAIWLDEEGEVFFASAEVG